MALAVLHLFAESATASVACRLPIAHQSMLCNLPAVAEKEGGALGEHGSGGDSNGGMERLPTLEWAARQGTRGNSPCPTGTATSPRPAAAGPTRQFSFGVPLASLNAAPGGAAGDNLAGSASAELFGPSVRIASAVGAKRPAQAAAWEAGAAAAGAGDSGSPSKRARPEVVAAPAHDPMAAPPMPRTASLQSMLGMLRQAAGMQPAQEQQWEADRHQLLRLLVASVAGGSGPAALPPTPPPTNQAVGGLEALLRGGPWVQPAPAQPSAQPAPMQQLMQLLGAGGDLGGGSQVLAQLALIKQLHQLQQAQAHQAQQAQHAQQAQQAQHAQQAAPNAFQGFQTAQPQQMQQQPQVQVQAAQQQPQPPAAGQATNVPEPVAMMYLQRIAKKLGENYVCRPRFAWGIARPAAVASCAPSRLASRAPRPTHALLLPPPLWPAGYNIDNIALQHQAQQQGGQQL